MKATTMSLTSLNTAPAANAGRALNVLHPEKRTPLQWGPDGEQQKVAMAGLHPAKCRHQGGDALAFILIADATDVAPTDGQTQGLARDFARDTPLGRCRIGHQGQASPQRPGQALESLEGDGVDHVEPVEGRGLDGHQIQPGTRP